MAKGGWTLKMRRVGRIKTVERGIVEITKGGAVSSMLIAQGEKAAARCNALAHLSHGNPLYTCQLKMLGKTASARVGVANSDACIDNLKNNTLKKGCGV